jgi:transaldolase
MAFYLDSTDIGEAETARDLGWVRGITTNPLLLARSELPPETTLQRLAAATAGEVFYQLLAADLAGMLVEAEKAITILGEQTVLKIPATLSGFQALARLSGQVACAVTAIYSPAQAAVAQAGGARYAIIYVDRSTRLLGDGPALVSEISGLLSGSSTEILAASLKSPEQAVAALRAGAHHLTLPLEQLFSLAAHEFTRQTVGEFAKSGRGIC